MQELLAMRDVFITAKRLRMCPPVDDEFPELIQKLDASINAAESVFNSDSSLTLNDLARVQYIWVEKMGWHNKTVLEALALIASEVGEAVNECRYEEPSEKLGEELADIILRTLDLAEWQGIDIEKSIIEKMAIDEARGTRGRRV